MMQAIMPKWLAERNDIDYAPLEAEDDVAGWPRTRDIERTATAIAMQRNHLIGRQSCSAPRLENPRRVADRATPKARRPSG
jgi:hypothetical protein